MQTFKFFKSKAFYFIRFLRIRPLIYALIAFLTFVIVRHRKVIGLTLYSWFFIERDAIIKPYIRDFSINNFQLTSKCQCRQDIVELRKNQNYYEIFTINDKSKKAIRLIEMNFNRLYSHVIYMTPYDEGLI